MAALNRLIAGGWVALLLMAAPAAAAAPDWSDYQIIMWQPQTAQGYRALQSIGVTAAMMHIDRDEPKRLVAEEFDPLRRANMRWYVENIATDFYSAYHRWFPDRPINWRYVEVENIYRKDPTAAAAFTRDPSLSDPAWLKKVSDRLRQAVEANRPYHPLFYNLADEAGIADLNAFWDFDFSPPSLRAMRRWLETRYGTLGALNAEWGSHFSSWDAVVPMTTAEAMKRTDNFAAWADFKAWMDVAFVRALEVGRDAIHAADPAALAGLEGAQKPGWGGYNYALLASAVDVMEGPPERLAHSLNPRLHLLTTSFFGGPAEEHRIWRALLNGVGGIIIWDAKRQFIDSEGAIGPRGRLAAPYFRLLRSGIGALVINSEETPSAIAILYSPSSLRLQWLLDWQDKGDGWLERGADAEDRDDGTVRAAMNAYERGLEQLGFDPRYLSSGMIETGALARGGYRVLILPHSIALSSTEAQSIREFVARGGTIPPTPSRDSLTSTAASSKNRGSPLSSVRARAVAQGRAGRNISRLERSWPIKAPIRKYVWLPTISHAWGPLWSAPARNRAWRCGTQRERRRTMSKCTSTATAKFSFSRSSGTSALGRARRRQ